MIRRHPFPAVFAHAPKTAAEMTTLMIMSPFVIGTRLTQFWASAASPQAKDREEAAQMVSEKMQAVGESVVAMNLAAVEAVTKATLAVATGSYLNDNHGDAIFSAGLKPYSQRVRANRKRLSR
ncbi:MAG: hypothetical protein V7704_14250 [Aurantimonas endophytica]|uniref:Uncharacterized protein n=1 Tax=Aurantimonas endophytica TaxID=1522175 RepID=A0A7W6MMT1_9HYPH|nr:hypothetical protein [Aurantimonas endophytica]MBB4001143.1 hypothetical protein [Aurantimonas endophytica]MCO6403202.1 hypothetical protein [Aurantimonas endophytica]